MSGRTAMIVSISIAFILTFIATGWLYFVSRTSDDKVENIETYDGVVSGSNGVTVLSGGEFIHSHTGGVETLLTSSDRPPIVMGADSFDTPGKCTDGNVETMCTARGSIPIMMFYLPGWSHITKCIIINRTDGLSAAEITNVTLTIEGIDIARIDSFRNRYTIEINRDGRDVVLWKPSGEFSVAGVEVWGYSVTPTFQ